MKGGQHQWNSSGAAAFKRSEFDLAVDCFTKALSVCAEDPAQQGPILNNRAASLAKLGRFREALHDVDQLLNLDISAKALVKKIQYLCEESDFGNAGNDLRDWLRKAWEDDCSGSHLKFATIVRDRCFHAELLKMEKDCNDTVMRFGTDKMKEVLKSARPDYSFLMQEDMQEFKRKIVMKGVPLEPYLTRALKVDFSTDDGHILFNHLMSALYFGQKIRSDMARTILEQSVLAQYGGETKFCSYCGAVPQHVKKCSKCNVARYCSEECQRQAWPMHKKLCGKSLLPEDAKNAKELRKAKKSTNEGLGHVMLLKLVDLPYQIQTCSSWNDVWEILELDRSDVPQLERMGLSSLYSYPLTILRALKELTIDVEHEACTIHAVGSQSRYEGRQDVRKAVLKLVRNFPRLRVEWFLSDSPGPSKYAQHLKRPDYSPPAMVWLMDPGLQHMQLWNWQEVLQQLMERSLCVCVTAWSLEEHDGLQTSMKDDCSRLNPLLPYVVLRQRNPFASLEVIQYPVYQKGKHVPAMMPRTNNMYYTLLRGAGKEVLHLRLMLETDVFGMMTLTSTLALQHKEMMEGARAALASGDKRRMQASLDKLDEFAKLVAQARESGSVSLVR